MVDFDTFYTSQLDHLIPRRNEGKDDPNNLVMACFVCNNLRGAFVPDFPLTDRRKFIDAIRDEIMHRRSKHMRDYASWTHGDRDEPPEPPQSVG